MILKFLIAGFACFLVGFAKSGISGIGIIAVPLMAEVFPAKLSVGVLLPILILGDIIALRFYKRFAYWKYIFLILPYTLIGIIIGYILMGRITNLFLRRFIGALIIFLIIIRNIVNRIDLSTIKFGKRIAPLLGIVAGVSTIMANAAGPLMSVYLLWMQIKKEEFLGTAAWYFFVLNCIKVPFIISLNLINSYTLKFDIMMAPFVVIGGIIGYKVIKKINQKLFENVVQFLVIIAGLKLLLF